MIEIINFKNKIAKRLMRGITVFMVISSLCSCATTTKIPLSQYKDLSKIEHDEELEYRIKLKDGTKYTVSKFSVSDTLLTIEAIHNADGLRDDVLIQNLLPYSMELNKVESIEGIKRSRAYQNAFYVLAVLIITVAIWFSTTETCFFCGN